MIITMTARSWRLRDRNTTVFPERPCGILSKQSGIAERESTRTRRQKEIISKRLKNPIMSDQNNIIIYNTADGKVSVALYATDGSVWMN
jgi:hypothetical protein